MLLVGNELHSLITLDILANLMNHISDHLTIKPKTNVIGFAEKVLQKISQSNDYTPDLPILSCIPGDLSPDESKFPWHMNQVPSALNRFGHRIACFNDFEIKVVPYLYILHCDIQYTGQSYPDIVNARIGIEEAFGTRKVLEFEMTSPVVFPPNTLESILTPQQLEELEKYIPKILVKLINEERYVIPYPFRYFVRLTGQSDNTSLFGENKLVPDYMCSYNFEIYVSLPTKLIVKHKGIIKQVNIGYNFALNQQESQIDQESEEKPQLVEFYNYEIDQDTGSLITYHIIKAEEESSNG